MSKRPLKPDEKRAWARVAKTVRARPEQIPLEMPPLDGLPPQKTGMDAKPTPISRKKPALTPLQQPAASLKALASPIPNRGKERRVRRGQMPISATLDLHGHTQESAQNLLASFLARQRLTAGGGCVLVITGKGRRGEGILRARLLDWLGTASARTLVSGYAQAHRKHGGSGAWYIFLRK